MSAIDDVCDDVLALGAVLMAAPYFSLASDSIW